MAVVFIKIEKEELRKNNTRRNKKSAGNPCETLHPIVRKN